MSAVDRTHAERGFTLVEALVATAVLAAISILMAPALIGAITAAGRNQIQTEGMEERAALHAVVHELFASTHQPAGGDSELEFVGTPNSVSFLIRPEGADLQRARLDLEQNRLLVSLSALEPADGGQQGQTTQALLADGFEAGRLTYLGIDRENWRRVNQSSWRDQVPPRLVVIALDWPDGSQTRIQAQVTGEGSFDCRFDSGRGLCLGDSY